MTKELNWKEQLHWDLFKQYLRTIRRVKRPNDSIQYYEYYEIYGAYEQSKLATEQFINHLAADARGELESTGWEEKNYQEMVDSYQEKWTNHRNGDCYHAVERALASKPLNH